MPSDTPDTELDRLEGILGLETVSKMAHIFVASLGAQRACFGPKAVQSAPDEARRAAHDLVTNAGSLGFRALSDGARRLEQAIIAQGPDVGALVLALSPLADEAEATLTKRYGS